MIPLDIFQNQFIDQPAYISLGLQLVDVDSSEIAKLRDLGLVCCPSLAAFPFLLSPVWLLSISLVVDLAISDISLSDLASVVAIVSLACVGCFHEILIIIKICLDLIAKYS